MELLIQLLGMLQDFAPLVIIAACMVAITKFKSLPPSHKWIAVYIILTCVLELITLLLSSSGIPNLILFHFYSYLELVTISLFFIQLFRSLRWQRMALVSQAWLIAGLLLFSVNTLFWEAPSTFNSIPRGIMAVVFMAFAATYLLKTLDSIAIQNVSRLWICSGLFIYFASSFCVFIVSNFTILLPRTQAYLVWGIHAIFCMIMYGMLISGLWKEQKI